MSHRKCLQVALSDVDMPHKSCPATAKMHPVGIMSTIGNSP